MPSDDKHNIESILRAYYIRYDKLWELNTIVNQTTSIKNPEYVDIYIDLYDMLKILYSTDIYANNSFTICSSVINIAAHLRGYYMTRHRLWSRIFLVYGEDSSINHKQFYPEFGDDRRDGAINYDFTRELIHSQLKLVKILSAYINELYFIERTTDFSMFTYDNILKNKNNISIILTRSKYVNQIPALLNNVYLFRPKKIRDVNKNSCDNSYVIFYSNALLTHYSRTPSILDKLKHINPNMLSLLMTFNGCSDKHVAPLINISRTVKVLIDAIATNKIINGYNSDITYVYDNLIIQNNLGFIDRMTFDYRFKAIDIPFQHMIYANSVESKDDTWRVDLKDPATVKAINNQYFIDNPLDLNNL